MRKSSRAAAERPVDPKSWRKQSKPDASGRSKGDRPHARLYHHVLDSDAWRSLTPQAVTVYLALCRRHNGINNGTIALSVRGAAARCSINKDTATRALHELQDKGFLIVRTPSQFNTNGRRATEYELTAYPCDGRPAQMDFMRWRPA